jgi:hypothetical protein
MSKYVIFIYLTICETSLILYEESNFSTYENYCRTLNAEIDSNRLSIEGKTHILKISNILEKIYGLDGFFIGKYISGYFNSKKCLEFEEHVRLSRDMFPFTYKKL